MDLLHSLEKYDEGAPDHTLAVYGDSKKKWLTEHQTQTQFSIWWI